MPKSYVPSKGDVVWLEFSPQAGHEQAGHRPALCISPIEYNRKVGLAIFCPITAHSKDYPFEVHLPQSIEISGVILSDHVKSLDWKARKAKFVCSIPINHLNEVVAKLRTLL